MMKKLISLLLAVMLLSTFAVVALANGEAAPAAKEFAYAYDCTRSPAFPSVQGGVTTFSGLRAAHETPEDGGTWTLTEAGTFSDFEDTENEEKVDEVCGLLADAYGEAKKGSFPIYSLVCGDTVIGTGYVALVATYKYEYAEGQFADVWFAVMDTHEGCGSVTGGYGYLFSTVELTAGFEVEPDEVVGEEVTDVEIVSVTVSPEEVSVKKGASQEFTAEVTAEAVDEEETPEIDERSTAEELDFDDTVTWSIEGAEAEDTVIDEDGVLTVSKNETAKEITVIATSNADDSVFGEATVTVVSSKKNEPDPCEHEFDKDNVCEKCGVKIIDNTDEETAETNPNTGAENAVSAALAAVIVSAAAVAIGKRK